MMVNAHLHLTTDANGQPRKHVERVGNAPIGRVLDRHKSIMNMAAIDLFKHGRNAADRNEIDALAETLNGC
jgi:hypothetical protein